MTETSTPAPADAALEVIQQAIDRQRETIEQQVQVINQHAQALNQEQARLLMMQGALEALNLMHAQMLSLAKGNQDGDELPAAGG